MEYREIGKTGLQAGVIGLGCEHMDGKPYAQVEETVRAALDCGVNVMDVFMPGREVRQNIAKALGADRDKVLIQGHIGSTDVKEQYDISRDLPTVQRYFEDMLRAFGGRVDFGMMFFIDSDEDYRAVFDTGFAPYVQRLKEQGDIGHIGFSSHDPVTAARVVNTGLPELMMFSINPAFDLYPADMHVLGDENQDPDLQAFHGMDPARAQLYRLCEGKGVGITVMKTLGAGKLISPQHTPFEKPLTVAQCIHYALTRPAVSSVLLGCSSGQEVRAAMDYFTTSDAHRDYSAILSTLKSDFRGHCVYCSHCQPCPAGIDIAAVNKYLDIARLDEGNIPPSIRSHYRALAPGGEACVACGNCEKRCPFSVPIIGNMAQAHRLLG